MKFLYINVSWRIVNTWPCEHVNSDCVSSEQLFASDMLSAADGVNRRFVDESLWTQSGLEKCLMSVFPSCFSAPLCVVFWTTDWNKTWPLCVCRTSQQQHKYFRQCESFNSDSLFWSGETCWDEKVSCDSLRFRLVCSYLFWESWFISPLN